MVRANCFEEFLFLFLLSFLVFLDRGFSCTRYILVLDTYHYVCIPEVHMVKASTPKPEKYDVVCIHIILMLM